MTTLDEQALTMADRIESAGKQEDADNLRASLAYIREGWAGNQGEGNLAESFESIQYAAEAAAEIIARHLDLTD